jgi:hypothetical protein
MRTNDPSPRDSFTWNYEWEMRVLQIRRENPKFLDTTRSRGLTPCQVGGRGSRRGCIKSRSLIIMGEEGFRLKLEGNVFDFSEVLYPFS